MRMRQGLRITDKGCLKDAVICVLRIVCIDWMQPAGGTRVQGGGVEPGARRTCWQTHGRWVSGSRQNGFFCSSCAHAAARKYLNDLVALVVSK